MKNIVLIFLGVAMILYSLTIGSAVFSEVSRKNTLERTVSHVVETTLSDCYGKTGAAEAGRQFIQELKETLGEDRRIEVQIRAADMEKGVLSVVVTETYRQMNGRTDRIVCEKTAIIEQARQPEKKVKVEFLVEEEVYKEFVLIQGEDCPIPKLPGEAFIGWELYGAEGSGPVDRIIGVEEDRTYVAITE